MKQNLASKTQLDVETVIQQELLAIERLKRLIEPPPKRSWHWSLLWRALFRSAQPQRILGPGLPLAKKDDWGWSLFKDREPHWPTK